MRDETFNVLKNFSKDDTKMIRERMIAMVLATDMTNHFPDIAKLKSRLAGGIKIENFLN